MNVRKAIEYWTRSAEYDLEVADSLFENKKYHYALFFGHLAIEKILKGIFVTWEAGRVYGILHRRKISQRYGIGF